MHIALVIPKGDNSPLAITGVSTIMHLAQSYGLPIHYQMISAHRSKSVHSGHITLNAHAKLADPVKADLILVPSIVGNPVQSLAQNQHLVDWLKDYRSRGAQIASLCTGAYLLAATGLLNGLEASSHCSAIEDLKTRFPSVKWAPEKIITDAKGLYTSGGTLSSFNVLIYLLAKHFDNEIAHKIAKFIQLDYPRNSQKPFFIVANQKNHTDELILAIQQHMEQQADVLINLDALAREFGLSRRSLNRRFKAATGDTPQTYIHRIKIEQVKQWLEHEDVTIGEAVYRIGYKDEQAFRSLFKKMTGMLPSAYQQRFRAL